MVLFRARIEDYSREPRKRHFEKASINLTSNYLLSCWYKSPSEDWCPSQENKSPRPRLSPQPHVVCPQAPCPDGAHAEHLTDKQPWGSVKGKPKREQEPKPVPGAQGPRQAASATQGPNLPCPLSPYAGASHQTEGQPAAC